MNSLIPICVNCKYFLSEPTGIHRLKSACAISAIDPVTGEETGKAKHAAQYRKDTGLCGPSGKFFLPGKPAPKKEKPKKEVKTVLVDVPEMNAMSGEEKAKITKDNPIFEELEKQEKFDKFLNSEEKPEAELLPLEEGKKRRRRSK
mgnify:CR=1 FL=1